MSGSVSKSLANRENAAESQPLSLLSTVASMVSEDPSKEMMQLEERHDGLPPPQTDAIKKSGSLSRSLSRSISSRNLMQDSAPSFPRQSNTNSLSRSVSSRNLLQQATATTSSEPLSHKRRRLNDMQQSLFETGTIPHVSSNLLAAPGGALRQKTKSCSFDTTATVSTNASSKEERALSFSASELQSVVYTPSDGIVNNVYRVHEMRLPDQFAMRNILPIGKMGETTKNQEVVDDYNYDMANTPLHIPPRLPSASESFKIAERSREEKDTWGWYA